MIYQTAVIDKPVFRIPDPQETVLKLIYGRFVGHAVCLAAKLDIASHVAAGTASTESLATILDANPASLRRFLLALASYGLLEEGQQDHWTLTETGDLLRAGAPGSLRDLARLFATREHAACWLALEYSILQGGCAFEHVHGKDAWSLAKENPAFNDAFNAAMSSIAGSVHLAIASVYDFSGTELLVDIGGGHGRLMSHILDRWSHLHGIVFDLPHVVMDDSGWITRRGLSDRCQAIGGDFFQGVPVGADAYIMTAVLHDWDDEACAAILRNCRNAMKPDGRILIGEFVLKPSNEPDLGRNIDLEMLLFSGGGRERTAEEFQLLLKRAGLELNRIVPLPAGTSLIEAVGQATQTALADSPSAAAITLVLPLGC